jgi:putative membrane protein
VSFVVSAVMALRNAGSPALAAIVGSGAVGHGLLRGRADARGAGRCSAHLQLHRLAPFPLPPERQRHPRRARLFSRTARSVPYERIQDVSLEQALIPRLFGMVDVKFETGAGGKDEVRIRYVTAQEPRRCARRVRARKSGEIVRAGEAAPAGEEPSRTLFAMDLKRLVTFGLFEFSLVVFAVLGGAAQQFDFLLPFDIWNPEAWCRLSRRAGAPAARSSA